MIGERRQYPRVRTDLPATIVFRDGVSAAATLLNLSRTGAQIGCDTTLARRMCRPTSPPEPFRPVELTLCVDLPICAEGTTRIEVTARVVVPRRVSAAEYRIGLRFIGIEPESDRVLERFLQRATIPA